MLLQVYCILLTLILLFSPLPSSLMLLIISTLFCLPLSLPSWVLAWKILTNLTGVINSNIAIMFMVIGKYCQGLLYLTESGVKKMLKVHCLDTPNITQI